MYARPLRRAHPHHVRLRALGPAAAELTGERLAHLVPQLLGVEQQAVEVEDDGVGQTGRYPSRTVGERRSGLAAFRALDLADEERVVARRMLGAHGADEPAASLREERRPGLVLAELDPVPERDRWNAPREVLRERLLFRAQEADAEAAGVAEQLMQRGLSPECEPDERRLEGEGGERADRDAGPLGSELDGDDADSGRKRPHHRPELVAAAHTANRMAVSACGRAGR